MINIYGMTTPMDSASMVIVDCVYATAIGRQILRRRRSGVMDARSYMRMYMWGNGHIVIRARKNPHHTTWPRRRRYHNG